jgi:GT2 family glycosyltransferase
MPGPDVSILICAHNRLDRTRECLRTLFATLPAGVRCEVLFHDDCSTDGTRAHVQDHLRDIVTVVAGTERGTFATNMNGLARVARGRWLCLLNNDTLLRPGWLAEMLHLAAREPRAAVVGNFHAFPHNGRVNHAGVVFDRDRTFLHLYQGMPERLPATFVSRPLQCVSAACMLVKASVFASLGGFDEDFKNGCEDLDLCLRVRQTGAEVWYCGTSRIEHFGQSTPGRMTHDAANLRRFRARWAASAHADLEEITTRDNVRWPSASLAYRLAYGIWKAPLAAGLRNLLMRTAFGVRLRQRALEALHDARV